jgi:ATP-dependent helicase/nuclease subunit A
MAARSLSGEQLAALELGRGPVLVSAGPGSGKTRLVVARLAQALREGVLPEQIAAITFTVRAAAELRSRLAGELGDRAAVARFFYIGTFHGLAAHLLRRNRLEIGLGERVAVVAEGEAALLRRRALRIALAGLEPAELVALAPYRLGGLERLIVEDLYQRLRTAGEREPVLPPADGEEPPALVGAVSGLLARFGAAYAGLKGRLGLLDFDDLELLALELLRGGGVERPALVVVDELQDVNPRQWQLLELLGKDRLFAVGDLRQSIYGFRDADPSIMERWGKRLAKEGRVAPLTTNYRAAPELVGFVNGVFSRWGEFGRLVAGRRPSGGNWRRVELVLCQKKIERNPALEGALGDAPGFRQAQALAVAQRVEALLGEGVRGEEIAVLARTRNQLAAYVQALELFGVPVHQGGGFWVDPAVAFLLDHLRAVANDRDSKALLRALASPLAGLSAAALGPLAAAQAKGLEEGLGGLELEEQPRRYLHALKVSRRRLPAVGIAACLEEALHLWPAAGERPAVAALLASARSFERRYGSKVRAFLRYAEQATVAAEREGSGVEGPPGMVRALTIHGAKGLEFEVVCLVEVDSGTRATYPFALVGEGKVGFRRQEDGEWINSPAYERLLARQREQEEGEERRLLYVALTRAKERLIIAGLQQEQRRENKGFAGLLWQAAGLPPLAEGSQVASSDLAVGRLLEAVPDPPPPQALRDEAAPQRPAAPALASPPKRLFLPFSSLSYSTIVQAQSCRLRFFVERVVGVGGRSETGRFAGRHLGTLCHDLLAKGNYRPTEEVLYRRAKELFGLEPSLAQVADLRSLLAAAGEGERLLGLSGLTVARELPFSLSLPGLAVPLIGVFDLYATGGGRTVVVDYKTDRLGGQRPAAVVERRYLLQQRLYGLAALQGGAGAVEVVHLFLRAPQEPVRVAFDRSAAEPLADGLAQEIAALFGAEPQPSSTPNRFLCAGCPAKGTLCPWPRERTEGPAT